jgi:site-specific DNA recombinase
MAQKYFAYIRVSTTKQGTEGVSLEEQRRAIEVWQARTKASIEDWFIEIRTAGKGSRPVFGQLLQKLRAGNGEWGLVIHKIDRGARNLRDWADIGELLDAGVTVRFAHDDLDLHSRGGRLAADIQAVVAADFVRNLRDEVRKGISGRLNQGLYPFQAPIGYRDNGRGRAKTPDPAIAPLIVYLFKCYASGTVSLGAVAEELLVRGLTGLGGHRLRTSALSKLLKNEFYTGIIVVKGKRYQGIHQPLVSREVFELVQATLSARRPHRRYRHHFQYCRRLQCASCSHLLIGEKQKAYTYYRCHRCRGVCVREDRITTDDVRFRIVPQPCLPKCPTLKPWEKFDSPMGIDKLIKVSS